MKYLELIKESNEELKERYALVTERVAGLAADAKEAGKYADYFEKTAQYLLLLHTVVEHAMKNEICNMEEHQAAELNHRFFADICGTAYDTSYLNPAYAVAQFGTEAGQLLSALSIRINICRKTAMEGNLLNLCIYSELFVELYSYFCEEEVELDLVKVVLPK